MAQSEQEILEGLAEIVNEETGLATDSVELDKSFTDDLDIDSISMMTIVVNAEEKFGVRSPTTRSRTSRPSATPSASSPARRADLVRAAGVRPARGRAGSAAGPPHPAPHAAQHRTHAAPLTKEHVTMTNRERRIVVTGLGATTPVGGTVPETWDAILAGRSGARTMRRTTGWRKYELPVTFAATIHSRRPTRSLDQGRDPPPRPLRASSPSSPPARRGRTPAPPRSSPSGSPSPSAPASAASGPCSTQWDTLREKGPRRVLPAGRPDAHAQRARPRPSRSTSAPAPARTRRVSACASGTEAHGLRRRA